MVSGNSMRSGMMARWLSLQRYHAAVRDPRQVGHIAVPSGEVVEREVAQVRVPTRTRHDLHHLDGRGQEILELPGRTLDFEPGAQVGLLRGDPDRAVVGVAGTHADAAD